MRFPGRGRVVAGAVVPVRMRNLKMVIAFDGAGYSGWQRQPDAPTIQGVLEQKLAIMTGETITVWGAGRTDAGVHALGMTANFQTEAGILCEGLLKGINSLLPSDIRVLSISDVGEDFHACHSAIAKTYFYNMIHGREALPSERLYNSAFRGHFALDTMRDCLEFIIGEHDFTSFEAVGSRDLSRTGGRGAVRRIYTAVIDEDPQCRGRALFTITGDGFLRHMVRNIVGSLVKVGQGKWSIADFKAVVEARDRQLAGPTAPACGLFLKQVHYDSIP